MMNHLWQSTIFAVAAGLLTLAFRSNRAQVRYWLWLAASVKFLIPIAPLLGLGANLVHHPTSAHAVAPAPIAITMAQFAEPFPQPAAPLRRPAKPARDWAGIAIVSIWPLGFLAIATWRFRGWLRVRSAIRASSPIDLQAPVEIRSSPGTLEPGVVGITHPVLLLPEGITDRLTQQQLEAVLAHELAHVRRRDNLFALVHMIVESMFWFHPLIWFIGARLIQERELACDEEVLAAGNQPHDYAEAILSVCKLYVESPLVCVAGVTGSDLKKRIHAIMTDAIAHDLNFVKKAALTIAAIIAIALPVAIGILNAPKLHAQARTGVRPQFEVAAIHPCAPNERNFYGAAPAPTGGNEKGGRSGGGPTSPGRVILPCLPVSILISRAYLEFGDGKYNSPASRDVRFDKGPDWIYAEESRYAINAKADDSAPQEVMNGPMMQALLEDRFKLKIHRETRETPIYALTVAKGGLKLKPWEPGSCIIRDLTQYPPQPIDRDGPPPCTIGRMISRGHSEMFSPGATMDELARALGGAAGRPVIDRTGIEGRFNFKIQFTPDPSTVRVPPGVEPPVAASDDAPAFPSIFTVLGDLGLKLEPSKGPREFLVIDHIEKPSEN